MRPQRWPDEVDPIPASRWSVYTTNHLVRCHLDLSVIAITRNRKECLKKYSAILVDVFGRNRLSAFEDMFARSKPIASHRT